MNVRNTLIEMNLQREEFEALSKLIQNFEAHNLVPIVDDDYPEIRHRYEVALQNFLKACKANGRTM